MRQQTERLYLWATEKANSKRAPFWMGLIFFFELFLFLPLDAVLVFFCLHDRKKTFLYVFIAAVVSSLSGLLGYVIGHFLWDLLGPFLVPTLVSVKSFAHMTHQLQVHETGAVLAASFLPFPLKILSLVAGVFQLGLLPFLTYLLLGRILRFSLLGAAMILWGEKVKSFVDKHFQKIFIAIGAKLAMAFLFLWALAK